MESIPVFKHPLTFGALRTFRIPFYTLESSTHGFEFVVYYLMIELEVSDLFDNVLLSGRWH